MDMIKHFLRDESGAEIAEYAVAAAIMVAVAVVVYQTLTAAVEQKMNQVADEIEPPAPAATPPAAP